MAPFVYDGSADHFEIERDENRPNDEEDRHSETTDTSDEEDIEIWRPSPDFEIWSPFANEERQAEPFERRQPPLGFLRGPRVERRPSPAAEFDENIENRPPYSEEDSDPSERSDEEGIWTPSPTFNNWSPISEETADDSEEERVESWTPSQVFENRAPLAEVRRPGTADWSYVEGIDVSRTSPYFEIVRSRNAEEQPEQVDWTPLSDFPVFSPFEVENGFPEVFDFEMQFRRDPENPMRPSLVAEFRRLSHYFAQRE